MIGLKVGDVVSQNASKIFREEHDLSRNIKIELSKAKQYKNNLVITIEEINERELADLNQELFDKVFGKNSVKSIARPRSRFI